jgi:hypothetical protein
MPLGPARNAIRSMDKLKKWFNTKDYAAQYAIIMIGIAFLLIVMAND